MARVYLGLGSNLGDRAAHLRRAGEAIEALPGTAVTGHSRTYETEPVGPQDQNRFLNSALAIDTVLTPEMLRQHLARIETRAGRADESRRQPMGPRELDIDILLYGDRRLRQPGLTVPHPHLAERWFVLKPLADLIPDTVPPGWTHNIRQALEAIEQTQGQGGRPVETQKEQAAQAGRT